VNLVQRVERLESTRIRGGGGATRLAMEAVNRRFEAMSDAELNALIAEGGKESGDPGIEAQLREMADDKLCILILEGERT
jgi:hypothetical protein